MADRAMQALAKLALEPEWEAKFEPNSYGFRPGRQAHGAIEAIFNAICLKPKYVLDADIEKCFDRISHDALLIKLNTTQPIRRLVRAWLKVLQDLCRQTHLQHDGLPDVAQAGSMGAMPASNQDSGLAVPPLLEETEDTDELQ